MTSADLARLEKRKQPQFAELRILTAQQDGDLLLKSGGLCIAAVCFAASGPAWSPDG